MPPPIPAVVSIDMGYGHLRAARPLAGVLGTEVLEVDRPPLAGPEERHTWERARATYERVSRASQWPLVGGPFRALLEGVTSIPDLYPYRDLSAPDVTVRTLARMVRDGLGDGLAAFLRASGRPLLTTFYAPAVIADHHGLPDIYCVVTDADLARVWAPATPAKTRIHYFAPSQRAQRRLRLYGVPPEQVHFSGFPLPDALVGGPSLVALKRNLASRLARLDRRGAFRDVYRDEVSHFLGALPPPPHAAPLLTFAVGGAGAQADMAALFLPRMSGAILSGRLRLALVAGVRREVSAYFREQLRGAGLEGALAEGRVRILEAETRDAYFDAFDALMAETDVLYTKPSELAFYAALGLPVVCARPVGHHERINRRFLLEAGAGLKQWDPRHVTEWVDEWLDDGTLAAAAWSGFMRLPKTGTYRILETIASRAEGRGAHLEPSLTPEAR